MIGEEDENCTTSFLKDGSKEAGGKMEAAANNSATTNASSSEKPEVVNNTNDDANKGNDPENDGDVSVYRGIYLPTFTNRFKCKKVEMAYQRYACRQVGALLSLAVLAILAVWITVSM